MRGAIPPLPEYDFMAWCSVKKHSENLKFYLLYMEAVPSIHNPRTQHALVTGTYITCVKNAFLQ
jgi:hypothetical protein